MRPLQQPLSLDDRLGHLTYDDLTEVQPQETKTDRELFPEKYLDHWANDGIMILESWVYPKLLDLYSALRSSLSMERSAKNNYWDGWHYPTPFMNHPELRDLALAPEIISVINDLVGEPMGLNLTLTGWISTQRNWHSDQYLNPRGLWSKYLAVWIALDDINEDAGPFEFVRGSHKWPVLTQDKLFAHLSPDEQKSPHWPTFTQEHVARCCEQEIAKRGAKIEPFVPKKGDILIWSSNLIHRGSVPKNKNLLRKSLICHYSSVPTRTKIDMPKTKRHTNGGYYFDLPSTGEIKP
jgi:hypothetical protein